MHIRFHLFIFLAIISTPALAKSKKINNIYYDSHYFILTNKWQGSDKALDVVNDGKKNNQIILTKTRGHSGQYWKITPSAKNPGYYRFTTEWQGDDASLDIINDRYNDNQPILASSSNSSGQLWKITPIRKYPGYYRLTTKWQGKNFSLSVVNDGVNNKLLLLETGSYSSQYWKISKTETPIASHSKLSWYSGRFGIDNGPFIGGFENENELYVYSSFNVMVNQISDNSIGWTYARDGYISKGAINDGKENNQELHICRMSHHGSTHPSKLVGESCNVGHRSGEVSRSKYEILVRT